MRVLLMYFSILILSLLFACNFGENEETESISIPHEDPAVNNQTADMVADIDSGKYELVQVDYYSFRRAYHESDALSGHALELFMNRNPEPILGYANSTERGLYMELVEAELIKDDNLNLSEIETLSSPFDYQTAQIKFQVETRLLEDPKALEETAYELTFKAKNKVVLMDTLEFGFPPDVTFFTRDLNADGNQELLILYKWYIVNGDNFDLAIYELKKE